MLGIRQFSLFTHKGNCLLFLFLLIAITSYSQEVHTDSSSVIIPDTLAKKEVKTHSPKKAAIFSAIIPGSGQVYNRKYWKVPIIYAGFGGLGYLFMQNNTEFRYYRDILLNRADSSATYVDPLPNVSNEQVFAYREDFRRYRDLCFVGMFAIYVLNIIDASVDAHMFTFDVSEDLSLHVSPYATPNLYLPPASGVTLTLKF